MRGFPSSGLGARYAKLQLRETGSWSLGTGKTSKLNGSGAGAWEPANGCEGIILS